MGERPVDLSNHLWTLVDHSCDELHHICPETDLLPSICAREDPPCSDDDEARTELSSG